MSATLTILACAHGPAVRPSAPAHAEVETSQLAFIEPDAAELVEADATELVIRPEASADEPIGPATASWYGPGMWGNRTACGHTLTASSRGWRTAHCPVAGW